jgi:hypothetical protein
MAVLLFDEQFPLRVIGCKNEVFNEMIPDFIRFYPIASGYKRLTRDGAYCYFPGSFLQVFQTRFSNPLIFDPRMK